MTDWVTLADVGTAVGTLVLADWPGKLGYTS
jgi:hypothetical protein